MKSKLSLLVMMMVSVLAVTCMVSCKKMKIVETTTTDVNIYDYLAQKPEDFSEIVKALNRTGYNEFLNAYGTYTFFAPNNEAVKAYLQETGKASIDAFSDAELKDLIRFHLIQDTINTSSFKDGKLPRVTMLGQYLVTGVTNTNGVSSFTVNRQATITQPNIRLANGNIHVINKVLKAATRTVAQTIEAKPEFSIFTQALK